MSPNRLRYVIEGVIMLAVLVLQGQLSRWLVEPAWFRGSRLRRLAIWTVNGLVALWLGATLVSTTGRAMMWFPRWR